MGQCVSRAGHNNINQHSDGENDATETVSDEAKDMMEQEYEDDFDDYEEDFEEGSSDSDDVIDDDDDINNNDEHVAMDRVPAYRCSQANSPSRQFMLFDILDLEFALINSSVNN